MPELPEVEVLVRHLAPILPGRAIRQVNVRRTRVIRPAAEAELANTVTGMAFRGVTRRAKYLLFELSDPRKKVSASLLGHLGMTGRMYVAPANRPLPKHAAVVFELGDVNFVFEDTRYFGRLTLDMSSLDLLGPEPLDAGFSDDYFLEQLKRSNQAIKVKLLDQSLVAGLGNIYAGEALFRALISPRIAARKLTAAQAQRLRLAIRDVLGEAIDRGLSMSPDFPGVGARDGIFYYGQSSDAAGTVEERFQVYDRAGKPCRQCSIPIRRIVQAARSTYFCPKCQKETK